MLRHIIRDFRQLHRALKRYYQRRAQRPPTPEQEAERAVARLNREQELARRLGWRR
jgi:hypothetical protein